MAIENISQIRAVGSIYEFFYQECTFFKKKKTLKSVAIKGFLSGIIKYVKEKENLWQKRNFYRFLLKKH
jgi:hypothetical protein